MQCPQCATELPDNAKFCGSCGFHIARPTPAVAGPSSGALVSSSAEVPALWEQPGGGRTYDQIAAAGVELPAGELIGEAWNLMKPNMGAMVGGGVLALIVAAVVSSVPVLGSFVAGVVMTGTLIPALRLISGKNVEIGHFFDAFKIFMPLFLLSIVSGLLTGVGLFLCLVPGIYLAFAWMWSGLLVIDRKEEFWPAMQASMKVVNGSFGAHFVFGLILGLLNFATIFTCGLGAILTFPLTMITLALAYRRVFGVQGGALAIEG